MAIVLPHGVLFRGGTEGEIRKRLLDKNYIDTIIGLPDKMFTNTGIPVTVMILKKNRNIGDPVLMIDASKDFIKVGKQNVLQEKDIAKIVDTYTERKEEKGYSYLAKREDIIENEYNLNIPRYIESIEEDIPHDVDAHLYGGIPWGNINELSVLQSTVPNVLDESLEEVREGYFVLSSTIDEITNNVLKAPTVAENSKEMEEKITSFINKYWVSLKTVADVNEIPKLRDEMFVEIKKLLSGFNHIDVYDGYQIVAELWRNTLTDDLEIIALSGFYEAGRTRIPHMVTKGSGRNKREDQDGWIGTIVPNTLITKHLYREELAEIEAKEAKLQEIDSELDELVEAAKVEDSEEENALGETFNAREDAFLVGAVRAGLKETKKDTIEYTLLKNVETLLSDRTKLNREVKALEKELKAATEERIVTLTNDEIDHLMYEKWFGNIVENMVRLIENPLKSELNILEMLQERYSDTLATIEAKSEQLEKELEAMMQELVVSES